jgi:multidrug efflux system outer membrane protein
MGYLKFAGAAAMVLVAGCAVGPAYKAPQATDQARFEASLPAVPQGQSVAELRSWWSQFDDPLVAELVDAAQGSNPTLAQALARIDQARAAAGYASGARYPELSAGASANRGRYMGADGSEVSTTSLRGLDASWEIDLFGGKRKAAAAADYRVAARTADWHAARVSLAAEVAGTLVSYRACVATAKVLEQDLGSRQQTAELSELNVKAGFSAAADNDLIAASAADARQRLSAQRALCDFDVKALVALVGIAEPALRTRLGASSVLPAPREIGVGMVPAQALSQRPDIAAAERELAAASADINVAQANRYPKIGLTGNIGIAGLHLGGQGSSTSTWSILPSLSIPLFDAGRRRADVSAAQARYDESYALYQQRVRAAVREIEEALVRLDAAARRQADAQAAALSYERYFNANNEEYKAGGRSLFQLEDARRSALSAQQVVIGVQRERVTAWIALYKALGGGWQAPARG